MATLAPAPIGHNAPPEPTPFDLARDTLADLDLEASAWFDGDPIANEGQASEVSRLLDAARKARSRFDADRKVEKAPHDQAAKAVDAKWKPLLTDADRIAEVAKGVLTPWLVEQDRIKREAEAAARAEADRKAEEARRAAEEHDGTLAAAKARDAAIEEARKADARATAASADKGRAKGEGMARAVSLRSVWRSEIIDRRALLNHVATVDADALTAFLTDWAAGEVRRGKRDVPGVRAWEERSAA